MKKRPDNWKDVSPPGRPISVSVAATFLISRLV